MDALRVLIADDEPLIRLGLRTALAPLDGVVVAGETGSGDETIASIGTLAPDLVLLDVEMPGGTGLDVVRRIGPARMPPVVFVTAFDDYAVDAFEINAVDYLLKPFDAERVHQAVARARARIRADRDGALAERLQALIAAPRERPPEHLVVRNGERYDIVPLEAVDWIEAADNYVWLHCGPKSHLLSETMTSLERRLDPQRFLRVHRSRMVNRARIVAVHTGLGGSYALELRDGTRLTTGRQYRPALQQFLRA